MQIFKQIKQRRAMLICAGLLLILIISLPAVVLAEQYGVVATAAADYSSGAHSVISVNPMGGSRTFSNNLVPSGSDVYVTAYGQNFYRLEKSNAHHVTKFNVGAADSYIYQFSTEGDDTFSNPNDMVFVSEEKAYILRYGTDTAWIVDPSVTKDQETQFKIGELDLSAYAETNGNPDGIPEMHAGIIVGKYLYIVLQKLDRNSFWAPTDQASVLVVDTETDSVVQEITLPAPNPMTIQYLEENQTIYVACAGDLYNPTVANGIVTINPATYDTDLLIDGLDMAYPGSIFGLVMVSSTKGYFVDYLYDFVNFISDSNLYTFDPSAVAPAGTVVAGFGNMQLGGMQNSLNLDQNGMLWVCNQTEARIDILNTTTDTIDESVSTSLNPVNVVFASTPDPVVLPPDGGDDDDDDLFNCFINTLR